MPKIELKLKPFQTPNFVQAILPVEHKRGEESISVPLKELTTADLDSLCDQFRADVFKAAGKYDDIPRQACECGR